MSFVTPGREYPELPRLLLAKARRFGDSPEFALLSDTDRLLPTIVCGAFGRYVNRLQADPDTAERDEVADALRAIEALAASRDPEVQNTLVVEVFEHLDLSEPQLRNFVQSLGPEARTLHETWISN